MATIFRFGKASHQKMGSLMLVATPTDTAGSSSAPPVVEKQAKSDKLVDGATVRCTYSACHGNPGNLTSRGFGRSRFGGGFGYGAPMSMMMMQMMMGGMGRAYDSDDLDNY